MVDNAKSYWCRWAWIALVGIAAFHLAFTFSALSFLVIVYLWSLFQLRLARSNRAAFYQGLLIGLACFAPQLTFFYTIFSWHAVILWLVLAFWIALFGVLARGAEIRLGKVRAAVLIPVIWLGLDYFKGELYYLKFPWFTPAYAFSNQHRASNIHWIGVYGVGFVLMAAVALYSVLPTKKAIAFAIVVCALIGGGAHIKPVTVSAPSTIGTRSLRVAAVQMEFPGVPEVLSALNKMDKEFPDANLFVLSEYTFHSPVPVGVTKWCRDHKRYLMAGGEDPVGKDYYNTVFVVGPNGQIVFRQQKSVPVPFMLDGLAGTSQQLWDSPWGKIGVAICYDQNYRRVVDRLVVMGAQALIFPTADSDWWGQHQHELHARTSPMRAAEFGIPIFRVASSGISQCVAANGEVTASAPFPGPGSTLSGVLELGQSGRLPPDHWFGPAAVGATGLFIPWLLFSTFRAKRLLVKGIST